MNPVHSARALIFSALFAALAQPVAAQLAGTCGWHFLDATASPPTIGTLLTRLAPPAEFAEVAAGVRRWYRECDHTASRVTARSLQRMMSRGTARGPEVKALLGTVLMRGPDVQVEHAEGAWLRPMHQVSNAERDGARLLAEVAGDVGWPDVVRELAAVTVSTRRGQTLSIAADGLGEVPETARDAAYWAARAEVSYARGEYEEAAAAAQRSFDGGSARGARILGMSRMLQDAQPQAGSEIYLRGLAMSDNTPDLHWYHDDIRLLLGADELEQWSALTADRAQWIRQRWDWRALQNGIDIADRLAEHQRRLVHILERFLRLSYRGAAPETAVWQSSPLAWLQPVDDRGIVYLRHGAPSDELILPRFGGGTPRLGWVYAGAGPMDALFEFDKADRADYFLAEPHPVCGGVRLPSGLRASAALPAAIDQLEWAQTIGRVDPELSKYYSQCAFNNILAATSFLHARDESRRAAVAAWNSETALPRLADPIRSITNLYAFRAGTGAELIAYVTVPGEPLTPRAGDGPVTYGLDLRLAAGNPVTGTVLRADTAITLVQQQRLPATSAVGTAVRLRVTPAERTAITLTVRNRFDSDQGQVLATTKAIPDYQSRSLMLSDLVIAHTRQGILQRGPASLAPAPGHVVAANAAFRLFHEVYGVERNEPLAIQVVIAPSSDSTIMARLRSLISDRTALVVDFEEAAEPDADGVLRLERDITADLQPGAYRIIVTVRSLRSSAEARAEANLIVESR